MRKRFLIASALVIAVTLLTQLLSVASQSRASRSVDLGFVAPELCPEPIDTAQLTVAGDQVMATTLGKKPKTLVKTSKRDRSVLTGSSSYITGVEHSGMLTATSPAVAATTCRAAQIDAWFVGGSGALESQSSLVMINQSAAAATAEVSAWTPNGPAAPITLTIPALGSSRLTLDRFEAASVVTRVRALSGRIGVYLMDQRARGLTKLGGDYVAAQASPERKSVLLGLIGKSQPRLRLLVPGNQDAVVRIDVAFGNDRYTPAGLDSLRLKAGSVVELSINVKNSTGYGALIVDADVPVAAGIYAPSNSPQRDFAWLAPSRALTSDAIALNAPNTDDALLLYTEADSSTVAATSVARTGNTQFVAKPFALKVLKKTLRLTKNEEIYVAHIVKTAGGFSILPLNPIERSQQRVAPVADLGVLGPR